MLRLICVIVFLLWLIGFSLHVAGSLIHLLLLIALVILLYDLLTGHRNPV
jgi:hypothetical protein